MLTDTSYKFIDFTENTLNNIYKSPSIKLGQPAKKLICLLFNRIAYANEMWKPNKHLITYTYNVNVNIDISYYPDTIQDSVNTNIRMYDKAAFTVGERHINLFVGHISNIAKHELEKIVKRTYIWLTIASFFADISCSQTLDIYLSMVEDIKKLPTSNMQYIDREHINTAFTYACKKDNEIHIFRKEEWFKVLIHESFHSFGLDFAKFKYINTNHEILKIFNVVADVRIFESYCELWAEVINAMFVVFFSTKWNENQNKWLQTCINKLQVLLSNEQTFSLFQCAKILSYYQLQYADILHQNGGTKSPNTNYRDKTHVLSYYIIKSLFMYHMNEFMEECIRINGYSINFNKDDSSIEENMHNYCKLVDILHDKPEFIRELNNMSSFVATNAAYRGAPSKIQHSLRMALYELK